MLCSNLLSGDAAAAEFREGPEKKTETRAPYRWREQQQRREESSSDGLWSANPKGVVDVVGSEGKSPGESHPVGCGVDFENEVRVEINVNVPIIIIWKGSGNPINPENGKGNPKNHIESSHPFNIQTSEARVSQSLCGAEQRGKWEYGKQRSSSGLCFRVRPTDGPRHTPYESWIRPSSGGPGTG